MAQLKEIQKYIHDWGKRKGWWDVPAPTVEHTSKTRYAPKEINVCEQIALMHSELSEALEEYRNGHAPTEVYYSESDKGPKPEGVGIELADCAIRILNWAEGWEIDIEEMIKLKMAYNEKRPYRHGGKKA